MRAHPPNRWISEILISICSNYYQFRRGFMCLPVSELRFNMHLHFIPGSHEKKFYVVELHLLVCRNVKSAFWMQPNHEDKKKYTNLLSELSWMRVPVANNWMLYIDLNPNSEYFAVWICEHLFLGISFISCSVFCKWTLLMIQMGFWC